MGTTPPSRRIGIFGGSFDPVHNAHVALAHAALNTLQLDELLWVPTGVPWQKQRVLAAHHHREAMVKLAMANEARFVLDRCELARPGPSYMLDTVRALQASQPAESIWFLIVGQDQLAQLHTWHGWQELLQCVTLAVAQRPGANLSVDAAVLDRATPVMVSLPSMHISSTQIRQRLQEHKSIDGLVPPAVASYIDKNLLYQEQQTGS